MTGVQTCALPIYHFPLSSPMQTPITPLAHHFPLFPLLVSYMNSPLNTLPICKPAAKTPCWQPLEDPSFGYKSHQEREEKGWSFGEKKGWLKGGEKRAKESFFWFLGGLPRVQKEWGFCLCFVEEKEERVVSHLWFLWCSFVVSPLGFKGCKWCNYVHHIPWMKNLFSLDNEPFYMLLHGINFIWYWC